MKERLDHTRTSQKIIAFAKGYTLDEELTSGSPVKTVAHVTAEFLKSAAFGYQLWVLARAKAVSQQKTV